MHLRCRFCKYVHAKEHSPGGKLLFTCIRRPVCPCFLLFAECALFSVRHRRIQLNKVGVLSQPFEVGTVAERRHGPMSQCDICVFRGSTLGGAIAMVHAGYSICKCFRNLFHSVFDGSLCYSCFVHPLAARSLTHSTMCSKIVHRYCHRWPGSTLSFGRLKAHCMRLFVRRANKRRIDKRHKPNRPLPHRRCRWRCCSFFPGIGCFFFGLFIHQPFHHLLVFLSSLRGASHRSMDLIFSLSPSLFHTFPWQRHLPFNFFFFSFFLAAFKLYNRRDGFEEGARTCEKSMD